MPLWCQWRRIAAAFGPGFDPTYEIGVAAPLRGTKLLFLRAVAVLCTSFVLATVGALLLPVLNWSTAAWILPALAAAGMTLALSTWFDPLRSALGVGCVWVSLVVVGETASEIALMAFRGEGQAIAAAVFAVSLLTLLLRRERLDTGTLT